MFESHHDKTYKIKWAQLRLISMYICTVWLESLLSVWRSYESKRVPSEDPDQIAWMQSLIWVFAAHTFHFAGFTMCWGERGGSVVECRTPEREVRGSRPTAAVLCPWARHFTPRKYWLITQEAMAPSRHDWKIVDWDVKPQHNQPTMCRLIF